MRLFAALLFAASFMAWGQPRSGPKFLRPFATGERLPNTTFAHAFPRFLSSVRPLAELDPDADPPKLRPPNPRDSMSVGVDSRGDPQIISRQFTKNPANPGGRPIWRLFYQNGAFISRQANGFSPKEVVDEQQDLTELDPLFPPNDYLDPPDLWVDAADGVHFAWIYDNYDPFNNFTSSKILYRKRTPGGILGEKIDLTQNDTDSAFINKRYSTVQVQVASDGIVHVVGRRNQEAASDRNPDQRVIHITFDPSKAVGPSNPSQPSPIPDSSPLDGAGVDLSIRFKLVGQDNDPWVVWEERPQGQFFQVFQARKFKGQWPPKQPFGSNDLNILDFAPDIAIDLGGFPHFVWAQMDRTTGETWIAHRFRPTGGVTRISEKPVEPDAAQSFYPRIVINSRNQPYVFWPGLSLAANVNGTWFRQEPVEAPENDAMGAPHEVAIFHGRIHVVDGFHYTRTMEYGLGVKDEPAMVEAFPGGLVNTATGNLHYRLPIFATAGVGPTQAFTLAYNSLEVQIGLVAPGWKLNYEMYLVDHWLGLNDPGNEPTENKEVITLFLADGRPVHFRYSQFNYLVADPEYKHFDRLERLTKDLVTEYWLTTKFGDVLFFNGQGKLREIAQATGNVLRIKWVSGLATQVEDMLVPGGVGRKTDIEYIGDKVRLITDPAQARYEFHYAGHKLLGVEFHGSPAKPAPSRTIYSFQYGGDFLVRRFLPPRGTVAAAPYGWTVGYFPDGRAISVTDPPAEFVTEGGAVAVGAPEMTVDYLGSQTFVTNRRGFPTKFVVEPRRQLALEIHDATLLLNPGTPGLFPIVRAVGDGFGNIVDVQDRWGQHTKYTYHRAAVPIHVGDNLHQILRPKPDGPGQEFVAAYTWTLDGFNRIGSIATYATPPGSVLPRERLTQYRYENRDGQLTGIIFPPVVRPDGEKQGEDATPVSRTFRYGGPRRALDLVTNEEGNSTQYLAFHPVHGLPLTVQRDGGTEPEGLQYDILGNLTEVQPPKGALANDAPLPIVYGLDGLYRVETVQDSKGFVSGYGYDEDSNLVRISPPPGGGGDRTRKFDARGYLIEGATPDGDWSQKVDANGNARQVRGLRGFTSFLETDPLDRVLETRIPGGSSLFGQGGGGPSSHTTRYLHDGFDAPTGSHFATVTQVGETNPSRVTQTTFDNRGRPISILEADGRTFTQNFFDEQDQLVARQLSFSEVLQTCTVLFRDARDRVDQVLLQDQPYVQGQTPGSQNEARSFTLYNKVGSVLRTVDPLGDVKTPSNAAHKVTFVRDARERVQFVIDGKGVAVQEVLYGDDDLPTELKVPDPETKGLARVTALRWSYTARKELKREENRDGFGITYTYGVLPGQLDTATDAKRRLTKVTYYPSTQRVEEVVVAQGTPDESRTKSVWEKGILAETHVYNPESKLYNSLWKRSYDQADRLERFQPPAPGIGTPMAAEQYFYNDFGEPRLLKAGTKEIESFYNALGQPRRTEWRGPATGFQDREFNGLGLLKSVSDGARAQAMDYDLWRGTPRVEEFKLGTQTFKMQSHDHDRAMNYTAFMDAAAGRHSWQVDENNRVREILYAEPPKGRKAAVPDSLLAIEYTPGGLLDRTILKNERGRAIATTTYTYDHLGRRKRARTLSERGAVLADFGWGYNEVDLVTSIAHHHLGTNAVITYTDRSEVKTETVSGAVSYQASYEYDPAGNRKRQVINGVAVDLEYNALSQLIRETGGRDVVHEYDPWGSEVRRVSAATFTESYVYNHLNLLSCYGNTQTGALFEYSYWPNGDRAGKKDANVAEGQVFIPRFGDVATEHDLSGALQQSYVQGVGLDDKLTRVPARGKRRHYVGDMVGTVSVTLSDRGTVEEQALRDVFGNLLMGGTPGERYGFAQRENDPESGLMNFRSRSYDSSVGRFLQNDPLTLNRGYDHYAYGRNNPVSNTDPTGEIVKFTRRGTGTGNQAVLDGLREVFGLGELRLDLLTNTVSFGTWNDSVRAGMGNYKGTRGDFVRKMFDPSTVYSIEEWVEENRAQVSARIEEAYVQLASDGRRRGLEFIIGGAAAAAQPVYMLHDIAWGINPTISEAPKSALVHRGIQRGLEGASLGRIWTENTAIGVAYANPVTGPVLGIYHLVYGFATDNPEQAGGGAFVLAASGSAWIRGSTQKVVNLGGEGEVPATVNVQPGRIGGRLDLAQANAVRVKLQSGQPVIRAYGDRLPFRTGSVDQVWANGVPVGPGRGYFGPNFSISEIFRIMKSGEGTWRGTSVPDDPYNFRD